jgi:GNAT superfamily N-acetyltransferase
MTLIAITVESPIRRSFRVEQVAGLFDLPLAEKSRETFTAEVPALDEPWRIGAIVGPSGSGKSTIARAAFGERLAVPSAWPSDRALIDAIGPGAIKQIVGILTAVGLGSPPTWLKPYHVLSNGERFRADLARALVQGSDGSLVVFDEFTSVVDRTVARSASAAIGKSIARGRLARRLVVATCHYDVVPWLAPDWVLDMATGRLARGSLRRPPIRLRVARCRQAVWRMFARHHYLTGGLSAGATCYLATWDEQPVAFCAVVALLGRKGHKRISRIVTLPDFQGLGIGMKLAERVAAHERSRGFRVNITASHPAVIGYCARSPAWRTIAVNRLGRRGQRIGERAIKTSAGRGVASFEFIGESLAARVSP